VNPSCTRRRERVLKRVRRSPPPLTHNNPTRKLATAPAMATPTIYTNLSEDANVQGQLFAGIKFWVAQRCPKRTAILDDIRNNGGQVVMLEKQADYMIADHSQRNCPPGSVSYTFITESLKQGELQDSEKHLAGPPFGTARDAGSVSRPAKSGRAAYTAEEDRILYKWVRDCEEQGGLASGNEIYKQLEAKHPRHTWQSWRDRYLKQLRDRPPSAFNIPDNAPPSPPSDEPAAPASVSKQERKVVPKKEKAWASNKTSKTINPDIHTVNDLDTLFDIDQWEELYAFVEEIQSCETYDETWKAYAEGKRQTVEQWKQYFEKVVAPQWHQDPVSKREKIKKKVEERLAEPASQTATQITTSQLDVEHKTKTPDPEEGQTPKTKRVMKGREERSKSEDARFDRYLDERYKGKSSSAYVIYAREKKWSVWNDEPGLDYSKWSPFASTCSGD
jgi:uncharacterized protein YifE (UPF0438 family)